MNGQKLIRLISHGGTRISRDWMIGSSSSSLRPVDAGWIPDYVLKSEKLVEQLPVFFRTISGQKPSREDLEKLLRIINQTNALS